MDGYRFAGDLAQGVTLFGCSAELLAQIHGHTDIYLLVAH